MGTSLNNTQSRGELTTASHTPVLLHSQVGNMKLFCIIFFIVLGTAAAARAPVSPDEVHFHDESSGLLRQGKQSTLNCLMGCTRELRVGMKATSNLDKVSKSRFFNMSRPCLVK